MMQSRTERRELQYTRQVRRRAGGRPRRKVHRESRGGRLRPDVNDGDDSARTGADGDQLGDTAPTDATLPADDEGDRLRLSPPDADRLDGIAALTVTEKACAVLAGMIGSDDVCVKLPSPTRPSPISSSESVSSFGGSGGESEPRRGGPRRPRATSAPNMSGSKKLVPSIGDQE